MIFYFDDVEQQCAVILEIKNDRTYSIIDITKKDILKSKKQVSVNSYTDVENLSFRGLIDTPMYLDCIQLEFISDLYEPEQLEYLQLLKCII